MCASEPGLCICVASVQKQADESVALHCIPEVAPGAKGWLEEWGGDNYFFIQFLKNDETIYGFYLLRFSINNRKTCQSCFSLGSWLCFMFGSQVFCLLLE